MRLFTAAAPAVAVASLILTGCASFSPDGGFGAVGAMTQERTGVMPIHQRTPSDAHAVQVRVAELLTQPLSAEGAVELALLSNQGLQARFAALGIAESELVRAGRLRNPSFSFGRMAGTGSVEIERSMVFNVLGLLTMPVAQAVEQRRFVETQTEAASEAVGLAAQTRGAYFSAVAAQQLVEYYQQVKEAADASNELAMRMLRAGNFNRLAQLRQQAFYADATSQLAQAQHQALAEREALARLLGLSGDQASFKLLPRLPELPKQPAEPKDAEQTALEKRLDVLMAKRATEAVAQSLGLTKATRVINVLHLGLANRNVTGEQRENGYEIELELPLFDFGSTRMARAEATYMQSVHRTAEVALNARSEVRESYSAYRTAYDLAKHHRDEMLPLSKRISEENLLRYNGMLIDVFELLADSREQVTSVTTSVRALRDFWVADTHLQTALTGRSPGASRLFTPTAAAAGSATAGH